MQQTTTPTQRLFSTSLIKRVLIGAGIALVLIVLFLISAGEGNPAWPKLWFIRPLIIVPLAGAGAGAFYDVVDSKMPRKGWGRVLAILISLIGFIIALWLGGVLGLDGTWWD